MNSKIIGLIFLSLIRRLKDLILSDFINQKNFKFGLIREKKYPNGINVTFFGLPSSSRSYFKKEIIISIANRNSQKMRIQI